MYLDAQGGLMKMEVLQTSEAFDSWVDIEGGDLWAQLSEASTFEASGAAYTRPLTRAQSEAVDDFHAKYGPTSVRPVDDGGFEALAVDDTDLYRLQLDADAAGSYSHLDTTGPNDLWSDIDEES